MRDTLMKGQCRNVCHKKHKMTLQLFSFIAFSIVFISIASLFFFTLVGSPSEEIDSNIVMSPTSPLSNWDPMKDDFLSSKNTYAVNTDDLDIVFQGHRMYKSFSQSGVLLSKQYHMQVLLNSFRLNGHTQGFHLPKQVRTTWLRSIMKRTT